jgi:HSP20 family protein
MTKTVRAIGIERLELERLRDQVGRLFVTLQEAVEADISPVPGVWCPPVDLCEHPTEVLVTVELPGIEAEAIEVRLTNLQLRISGQKTHTPRSGVVSHLCSERTYGHFSRMIPLRWSISVPESSAELNNGVLKVRLPKMQDRRGEEFRVPVKMSDPN